MRIRRNYKKTAFAVFLACLCILQGKGAKAASFPEIESGAEESVPEMTAAESQASESETIEAEMTEAETTDTEIKESESAFVLETEGLYTEEESLRLYQFGEFPETGEISFYASDRNRQEAEQAIYNSLNRVEGTLDLSCFVLTQKEVSDAIANVVNRSPELFYVGKTYSVQYDSSGVVHAVEWRYAETDRAAIGRMKEAMEFRCAQILGRVSGDMSDVEKLMVLHDALVMNTTYTMDTVWNPGQGCYTAYCVLVEGKGVCHGYALALSCLASRLGIDTRFVASTDLNHAWNLVRAEGEWYHLDCTWDDPMTGRGAEAVYHKNFLLSDAGIRGTGHRVWNDPSLSGVSERFDDYYWRDIAGPIFRGTGGWRYLPPAMTGDSTVIDVYAENGTVYYKTRDASGREGSRSVSERDVPLLQERLILSDPGIRYQSSVQSYGWQGWAADGESSGTENQSKRLEAVRILLDGQPCSGGIQYRAHVQTYGWQAWTADGGVSGTENQSKRLEAVQIRLTGEMAQHYDVYYRVHAQSYGWLDWAKNGESAGTEGLGKRLEAFQVRLVRKGAGAPGGTELPYVKKNGIRYQTHVQTYGWQGYVADAAVSGTVGRSKRLEGINISLAHHDAGGGLEYRAHVQTYGWQEYVPEGGISGTEGQSKRLEAIQIRLTGTMARQYDVYYRVHVQTYGWLGWAKNGEEAGTEGMSRRLEGIQIVLVPKGGGAPGSLAGRYLKR